MLLLGHEMPSPHRAKRGYNRKQAQRTRRRNERERHLQVLNHVDRVLTVERWARANSLSLSTARRIIREGRGPVVVRLTERRLGIRESDNRRWQDARIVR